MHIFRSTLAAAMLILTLATTAAAQTKGRKAAYVPKHEVTISGAVGYNSFLSSRQDGLPLHQDSFFDEFSASILFFPIEIGYTFHIDKHWGVSTGIGLQAHGGIYGNTGTHYIYQSGTRPLPVSPTDPPASFAQTWMRTQAGLFDDVSTFSPSAPETLPSLTGLPSWKRR